MLMDYGAPALQPINPDPHSRRVRSRSLLTALVPAFVLVLVPSVSCLAQAEPDGHGFYIAPIVQAVRTDDDRSVDDDPAFTLAAGFRLHRNWNAELNLFRGRFDGTAGDDLQVDAVGVNALRVFRRDARIAPYLLFGLGSQRKDQPSSGTSTDAYADAGAGLLTTLYDAEDSGRSLLLRVDLRVRYDDGGSHLDHMLGLGLQYAFGASHREPTPAPAPSPAPPPVPPAVADEDGDGVVDGRDGCPGTPPGTIVGADGCELDSDGDGVADSVPDECPHTPAETRIDARGCNLGTEIQLPLVTFDFDSDRLQPGAFAALDKAILTLRMNSDLAIEVAGHTDGFGSETYNRSLSQRRAEAVRRYLVDNGVSNVLTVRGYGESEPVADNATEAGRAENRRVVLRILSP